MTNLVLVGARLRVANHSDNSSDRGNLFVSTKFDKNIY